MEQTRKSVDPWRILAGFPGYPEFEPKEEVLTMEGEADAKLIAAAPDLLAACELALAFMKCQGINNVTRIRIEEAIEKAKSEA